MGKLDKIETICPVCGYAWEYKGKKLPLIELGMHVYVTCPACRGNVKLGSG